MKSYVPPLPTQKIWQYFMWQLNISKVSYETLACQVLECHNGVSTD